jgi:hypothetical protein
MMDKRYQVFISSTYADLEVERRAVIQTVIELDCIPAGMELFPAADEDQFEFIKRVIDDCDYYLLIVGGRYGSTTEDGISFTEREYDYAVECGLKVIALIHGSPDDIPLGKSEKDPVLRERLERFRDKLASGRLVKFWTSAGELPGLVALSLSKTIKMFPATGWVRASGVASEEILGEVNELRKQNDDLKRSVAAMAAAANPPVEDMAGLDDLFEVEGSSTRYSGSSSYSSHWSVKASWRDIFAAVAPYLYEYPNDVRVKDILEAAMFKRSKHAGSSPHMDDQVFKTISVQLRALGLVKTDYTKTTAGGMGFFWSLTSAGEREMLKARVVRTEGAAAQADDGPCPTNGST